MSKVKLYIEDNLYDVDEQADGLYVDGKLYETNIRKITENEYSILVEGKSYHLFFSSGSKYFNARINNHLFEIKRHSLRDELAERFLKKAHDHTSAITFRAPMPGLVTKIIRHTDLHVNEGEGVLVVEAMKMENEIKSSKTGVIKKIFVQEKQAVEKGDPLFTID